MAATAIGFAIPVMASLGVVLALAAIQAARFRSGALPGKKIETLATLWTLTLYLMLGLVPLLVL